MVLKGGNLLLVLQVTGGSLQESREALAIAETDGLSCYHHFLCDDFHVRNLAFQ